MAAVNARISSALDSAGRTERLIDPEKELLYGLVSLVTGVPTLALTTSAQIVERVYTEGVTKKKRRRRLSFNFSKRNKMATLPIGQFTDLRVEDFRSDDERWERRKIENMGRIQEALSLKDRVSIIGWNADWHQGQFELNKEGYSGYLGKLYGEPEWSTSVPSRPYEFKDAYPHRQCLDGNELAVIPVLNIMMALASFSRALLCSLPSKIREEDALKYRLLIFLVGVAELTWIGGVVVHGIASVYFHFSRRSSVET